MKRLSKTNNTTFILTLLFLSITFSSCVKKNPGPGGTSAIKGKVTGQDFNAGENEIQQIIFTGGAQIEHGDYFLLNEVKDGNNYYVYFKNPNWVSPADPAIQGRVGIEVIFNYSDSNLDIALAVKNKLTSLGVLNFTMALDGDILTLAFKSRQAVPDPDNGTTNFAMDVVNQGSPDQLVSTILNMAEKRVYLCYGDSQYASEDIRTNQNGEFMFTGLQPGKYKVYVMSDNPTVSNMQNEVASVVQITEDESIIDAGTLQIYF
jgi:hypothetical protein